MKKLNEEELVADATFYLFFIEDTQNQEILCRILKSFKSHLSPTVYYELNLKDKTNELNNLIESNCNIFKDTRIKYSEALRPVFSKDELKKGEHEIIAIAVLLKEIKLNFILIIDDEGPRAIIKNHFKYLVPHLIRTGRFIEQCLSKYSIIEKDEVLKLLNDMKNSKFRIDQGPINSLIEEVKAWHQ